MTCFFFFLLILATDPTFLGLILAHKVTAGVIVYGLFSAIVDGMPPPDAGSGRAYRWLYGSMNALAMNVRTALIAFFPRIGLLLNRAPAPAAETNSEAPPNAAESSPSKE